MVRKPKISLNSNQNSIDCCIYTNRCEALYIILKYTLSTLVYYCNWDTEQGSYGLGDFPVIVRHTNERTSTKPELGN